MRNLKQSGEINSSKHRKRLSMNRMVYYLSTTFTFSYETIRYDHIELIVLNGQVNKRWCLQMKMLLKNDTFICYQLPMKTIFLLRYKPPFFSLWYKNIFMYIKPLSNCKSFFNSIVHRFFFTMTTFRNGRCFYHLLLAVTRLTIELSNGGFSEHPVGQHGSVELYSTPKWTLWKTADYRFTTASLFYAEADER